MLSCVNSLYILDTNPLLGMSFTNIFSHSVGCILNFLLFPLLCTSFFYLGERESRGGTEGKERERENSKQTLC